MRSVPARSDPFRRAGAAAPSSKLNVTARFSVTTALARASAATICSAVRVGTSRSSVEESGPKCTLTVREP